MQRGAVGATCSPLPHSVKIQIRQGLKPSFNNINLHFLFCNIKITSLKIKSSLFTCKVYLSFEAPETLYLLDLS